MGLLGENGVMYGR